VSHPSPPAESKVTVDLRASLRRLSKNPWRLMGLAAAGSEFARDGEQARDLLVRLAEPPGERATEGPQELRRQGRPALHEHLHLLVRDAQDLAVGVRDGMGGRRCAVEELDLPEELTRPEDREGLLADAGHELADAHAPLVDHVELPTRRALGQDDHALG